MKYWTTTEIRLIRENIHLSDSQIAKMIGSDVTESMVKGVRRRNGITKPTSWKFKKGNIPWNTGKTFHAKGRSVETQFKKGDKPSNTKYDGCISVRKDSKTGTSYKYIRISSRNWELLHRQIWKKANGEIPKGMLVVFKDGDTMNVELSNLELITMKENIKRNINRTKAAESMRRTNAIKRAYRAYGVEKTFS